MAGILVREFELNTVDRHRNSDRSAITLFYMEAQTKSDFINVKNQIVKD